LTSDKDCNRNRRPGIAVLVPNWNDSRHLPRCLGSVVDQAHPADELIVVDDCSTDDSVEVIKPYVARHPGGKLIVNERNLGVYGAVEEGLRQVRSDYVLFLSANDFVLPGIFEHARRCLAAAPGIGLWSALAWIVDDSGRAIRLHLSPVVALRDAVFPPDECVRLAHRFGSWFTGTTLVYHREALAAAGSFDPAYGGLSDLITALAVASKHGAAYSPEPYAVIRMHGDSVLSGTLKDATRLDGMLARLAVRGPQIAPRLFDAAFLERTALRFRFSVVRENRGLSLPDVAARLRGWRRKALLAVDRALPGSWSRARVAAAFFVMRPYDIVPTFIYRIGGWCAVRLKLFLSGRQPP
jgi:glycosyltransferase involved in cell wall biosynthesis